MAKRKSAANAPLAKSRDADLRIIGGQFRGSKLLQLHLEKGEDLVTRPMKHRVREAIFNLVSTEAEGRHAIDLFAGTGALGLEAISRGAVSATFIERHIPTARVVRENITNLGVDEQCELLETSAFLWVKRDLLKGEVGSRKGDAIARSPLSWLVFISPPYAFYVERQDEMLALVSAMMEHAPVGSTLVVEADERFNFALLPGGVKEGRDGDGWDVRTYPPAVVGVWRKAC